MYKIDEEWILNLWFIAGSRSSWEKPHPNAVIDC